MTDSSPNSNPGRAPDAESPEQRLDAVYKGIRRIVHDMSSPLGIIRMAVYVLQTASPDDAKRKEYHRLLNESIDRIDDHLTQLRSLTGPAGEPDSGKQEP